MSGVGASRTWDILLSLVPGSVLVYTLLAQSTERFGVPFLWFFLSSAVSLGCCGHHGECWRRWSRSWNWGRYNWQFAHSWHKVVEMGRRMQALDPSDRPDLPSLRCIVAEFNKLNNAPSRRLGEQF